tara:strand:+ start:1859 stop:1996 length:138 start_codon:yes stop_codon:yes gene_type:complete
MKKYHHIDGRSHFNSKEKAAVEVIPPGYALMNQLDQFCNNFSNRE